MPRWQPNTRMRLVEAALELFEERGYDATGVADIAERAGLTKTTFFRQFPDKREVLFAGQEDHCGAIAAAIGQAPDDATALEAVGAALQALSRTLPLERHAFAARLRAVIDAHAVLQEREALKREGYLAAMTGALAARDVPPATAAVAADLGVLAFKLAFASWADDDRPPPLTELSATTLAELRAASAALA